MKYCYVCKETKHLFCFGNNRATPDGLKRECKDCRKTQEAKTGQTKKYRQSVKDKVYAHYCPNKIECNICGFDNQLALSIDHINGDGAKQRSDGIGNSSTNLYNWIIRNNYPDDYQVLCMNCNRIKYIEQDRPGTITVTDRIINQKNKVFTYYCGNNICCKICGYTNQLALTVDHIDGGGCEHRKVSGTHTLLAWLIKYNFPPGYQILCMNCNVIKYREELI